MSQREYISVQSAEGAFGAYMSVPRQPKPVAVVVLQEIFGVNANIRATVDSFADAGFAAIAPDLFWRQDPGVQLNPASDRERAMELMKGLQHDQAVADGRAALEALRARIPNLTRSASVGYCFGGGVAYLMAARGAVDAGVSYYGTGLPPMLGEMDGLTSRLLLHIAAEDQVCPPEAQEAIKVAAAKAGDHVEVIVHPGVGHAFARLDGATFDAAAAERANAKTMALLDELAAG